MFLAEETDELLGDPDFMKEIIDELDPENKDKTKDLAKV